MFDVLSGIVSADYCLGGQRRHFRRYLKCKPLSDAGVIYLLYWIFVCSLTLPDALELMSILLERNYSYFKADRMTTVFSPGVFCLEHAAFPL